MVRVMVRESWLGCGKRAWLGCVSVCMHVLVYAYTLGMIVVITAHACMDRACTVMTGVRVIVMASS